MKRVRHYLKAKTLTCAVIVLVSLISVPALAQDDGGPEVPEEATELERAYIYANYGINTAFNPNFNVDVAIGHDYIYRAIDILRREGDYVGEVECLYNLAITFQNMRDADNLARIIADMQRVAKAHPHPDILYKMYAVQSARFSTLALEADYENKAHNDSTMVYMYKSLALIECCSSELNQGLSPGWSYYSMATCHYNFYDDRSDSVVWYLNKALAEKELIREEIPASELEVSVYVQLSELHFRDGELAKAEEEALHVLRVAEPFKDDDTMIVDFAETYALLVKLYEQTGRPAEALKYQKMLQELEQRRYDADKILALNDMAAKHEHEKQREQITDLTEEKRHVQIISWLLGIATLLLAVSLFALALLTRMRRKNIELELYETALLAEQKQSELKNIKQGLKTSLFTVAREQLVQLINTSVLEQETKELYLEKLSGFDITTLDKAILASDATFSSMDVRYLLCFAIDMKTGDIATLFNIEPASVNTVRYRIRKKAGKSSNLPV
jgi:hypothetical protein